jgi:ubiquitin-protein ligase
MQKPASTITRARQGLAREKEAPSCAAPEVRKVFQQRHQRLLADRATLEGLTASSTILTWEASGEAPDRYTITFHGNGLVREPGQTAVRVADQHRCLVRLPFSYPQTAPDIQWLTPLYHPNVAFGGLVSLEDVGLPWNAEMGLDIVCERLWDVLRLAYVNPQRIVQPGAASHLREATWNLPLDERPLRDCVARQVRNVVRYEPRAPTPPATSPTWDLTQSVQETPNDVATPSSAPGILYIGDEERG